MAEGVAARRLHIGILGAFRVLAGETDVTVSGGTQRLIAFLALKSCWVKRALVAGTLWPDASESRAHASLRSTLSRMELTVRDAVEVTNFQLRLTSTVSVDLAESRCMAQRLLAPAAVVDEADTGVSALNALSVDLLPDWYDDWVLLEVEDWRQLRLHALEALAARLIARDRFSDAVRAALAAVRADPLRESAHASLISVHLAEGNQSEALRVFTRYSELLWNELKVRPSSRLQGLVSGLAQAV
jgi:SARP family transcriptional regulator, regulator of embCAB operon